MKQMKKLLSAALALALILSSLLAFSACSKNPTVYLAIEDYGIVTIELYEGDAPITVANFISLVEKGFYDGLTFHRIIESFMIQGGDPMGDGTGGADQHDEGTISMARSGSPYESYLYAGYDVPMEYLSPAFNSASSQFFIVTETSANNTASLDGKYAAFGRVTEGMEIIKQIAAVKTDADDKPLFPTFAIRSADRHASKRLLRGE